MVGETTPSNSSRATAAASLLVRHTSIFRVLRDPGDTHRELWGSSTISTRPRFKSLRLKQGFSTPRAFTHNLSDTEREWLNENLVTKNPVVLDITAGGGSIPFEAGRLGFRTIANELNPVAGLILRATCEWPQRYGWELMDHFQEVKEPLLGPSI